MRPPLFVLYVIITSVVSFGVGKFSTLNNSPKIINHNVEYFDDIKISHNSTLDAEEKIVETYVASVNGAKFYPVTCAAANRINEENKIFFDGEESARKAGYLPSNQCADSY